MSCAVDDGNAVSCWRQLPAIGPYPIPSPVSGVASATMVATGEPFACAAVGQDGDADDPVVVQF